MLACADHRIHERDRWVEVCTGDRGEQQNQHTEAECGRDRVFEQLQADIGRESARGDAGADHHGDQQRGADELGAESPRQGGGGTGWRRFWIGGVHGLLGLTTL